MKGPARKRRSPAAYTPDVVLRTAASVDTGIYAVGLDVGGTALEVAQRGFSSMLSNRMSQLGRWTFGGPRPAVRLADDLVVHLLERERSSRFERAVIGVACPVWFGAAERHLLAEAIDPRRRHTLVSCTTTTAAAVGTNLAADDPLVHEFVLALDLDIGFSASIVEVGRGVIRECCAVGLSPRQLRGETSAAGIVPGTRQRDRAIAALLRDSGDAGCTGVRRVVSVGEESAAEVERMLAGVHDAWAECPIETIRSRSAVARGAAFLADPVGGAEVYGIAAELARSAGWEDDVDGEREPDGAADAADAADAGDAVDLERSGDARGAGDAWSGWRVSGSVSRALGVLMDDSDGGPVIHPMLERGARAPLSCEQPFDLGPDDGMDVFVDLYEQHALASSDAPSDHRVVATSRHRPEARRRSEVIVSFSIRRDGRVDVGPVDEWTTEWREAEIDVIAVPRDLVDGNGRTVRSDRAAVRPLILPTVVEPAEPEPAEPEPAEPEPEPEPTEPEPTEPEPEPEPTAEVALHRDDLPVAPGHARRDAASLASTPTPAIAGALQRCERFLSYELGQMVAVRSVYALLDDADDAPPDLLLARAARLERSIAGRDDDLADALRIAAAAIRRGIAIGSDDWYFGGSTADVDRELALVIEHLMVVVGFVSTAEQRRLVHDAQLLGLSPRRAVDAVRALVAQFQGDRLQMPVAPDDDGCRTVRLDLRTRRFVLDADDARGTNGASSDTDVQADVQADVTMRVLLDQR